MSVYNNSVVECVEKRLVMKKIISRRLLFILTIIAAIFFSFVMFELQVLPLKYYIPLVVMIFLGAFLLYRGEKDKHNQHSIKVTLLKFVNVILAVLLVVGSLYAMKGSDFLAAITGGGDQTIEMHVAVLKDSPYQSLNDLKGKPFGANTIDAVNINKTEAAIEDEIGDIDVTAASSLKQLLLKQ